MTHDELQSKIANLKKLRANAGFTSFAMAARSDALPIIDAQIERIAEAEKILRDIDSNFDVDDRIQLQIDAYLQAKENANG